MSDRDLPSPPADPDPDADPGAAGSGLQAFRPAERQVPQDWDRLAAHLAAQGMALAREPAPRQFAGGFANLNYLLTVDGKPVVLRRPPPGPLPPGGNDMAREYRVLSVLTDAFPPAPRCLFHGTDTTVLGAEFLLTEFRPGLVIGAELPAGIARRPGAGARLSDVLVDTLADLHAVDPAAVGLGGFGRPEGFLERTVEGWARRAELAMDEGAPPPVVAALAGWLRGRRVRPQTPTLLHNDFKLDNLVLDPASLAPVAVLDWDMATRGDPLVDLGTLLSYWTEPGDPPAMHDLAQMPTGGGGFPGRAAVVEAYARRTGRDVSDILFYRVLTAFKLGVVFLQLHARHRRGEATDPRFAGFGVLAEGLLDFAWSVAAGDAF